MSTPPWIPGRDLNEDHRQLQRKLVESERELVRLERAMRWIEPLAALAWGFVVFLIFVDGDPASGWSDAVSWGLLTANWWWFLNRRRPPAAAPTASIVVRVKEDKLVRP